MSNLDDKDLELLEEHINIFLCFKLLSIGYKCFKHLIQEGDKNEQEV